jgi:ribosomal protein L11 methyltransferase
VNKTLSVPIEQQKKRLWHALDVGVDPAACEAVEYALMEAGALGTETNDGEQELLRVTAYFNEVPDRERLRTELAEALLIYSLPPSSVRDMSVREVTDRDWLAEWKKSWQPVEVGERFIIAPPWCEITGARDRFAIRIEPAMAFGTGTHETTQLCLRLLEKYFAGGSFLDVGTGTGILAIAAAMLSPGSRIEACDTDRDAVAIARDNAKLNGVAKIAFRVGTVDETTASADCVCANLTAGTIIDLFPSLLAATCGRLILSGVLTSQVETVLSRLQELGIAQPLEMKTAGEWAAIVI